MGTSCAGQLWLDKGWPRPCRPCWSRTAADEAAAEDLASETLSPGQVLFTVLCNQAPFSSARGRLGWTRVLLLLFLFVAPKVEKRVGVHPSALSWAVYYAN